MKQICKTLCFLIDRAIRRFLLGTALFLSILAAQALPVRALDAGLKSQLESQCADRIYVLRRMTMWVHTPVCDLVLNDGLKLGVYINVDHQPVPSLLKSNFANYLEFLPESDIFALKRTKSDGVYIIGNSEDKKSDITYGIGSITSYAVKLDDNIYWIKCREIRTGCIIYKSFYTRESNDVGDDYCDVSLQYDFDIDRGVLDLRYFTISISEASKFISERYIDALRELCP